MRDYIIARPQAAKYFEWIDGETYLARTVFEQEELVDIGILDADGNKVMARQKMDPIGFIRR